MHFVSTTMRLFAIFRLLFTCDIGCDTIKVYVTAFCKCRLSLSPIKSEPRNWVMLSVGKTCMIQLFLIMRCTVWKMVVYKRHVTNVAWWVWPMATLFSAPEVWETSKTKFLFHCDNQTVITHNNEFSAGHSYQNVTVNGQGKGLTTVYWIRDVFCYWSLKKFYSFFFFFRAQEVLWANFFKNVLWGTDIFRVST